ncbi:MAG: hypothetical protein WCQ57_16655, partial [Verrucomicrobiota bacterium]
KSIIVMDAATAHWLAELFPGARVETLSNSGLVIPSAQVGRPRKHGSASERVTAHRCKQRHRKWLMPFCSEGTAEVPSFGTVYATIYDAEPLAYLDTGDVEAFIQLLRDAHRRVTRTKHHNFLVSPGHFVPDVDGIDTRRGLANIQHANGIWLDNDGGDLSHAHFSGLFPQLRMIVWNTYSSTPERPRWRCFIPTTTVMSAEDYWRIVRQILLVLRHNGFASADEVASNPSVARRFHGFDPSKLKASDLFYAPCQAAQPEHSFFHDHQGGGREALDIQQWLKNDIVAPAAQEQADEYGIEETLVGELDPIDAQTPIVNSALSRWRSTPRGEGHRGFFRLACELRRAGMGRVRARHHLHVEARYAHSPSDRQADVRHILNRLWGKG